MDKLEGPWSCLTFLGFELDSSALEIWLAQAKLRELQHLISTWVGPQVLLTERVGIVDGAVGTLQPGSSPRQNVHAVVIRAIAWDPTASSSHSLQCSIPVGCFMVGHLSEHLEWGGSDADFIRAAGTSCVDGCL